MTLHRMTEQAGIVNKQIQGLKLQGYGEQYTVKLPTIAMTTNEIPINKNHIPTKEAQQKDGDI